MVSIEILEGKILTIDSQDDRLVIITPGDKTGYEELKLSKSQAETLAAVLSVMAKQLD